MFVLGPLLLFSKLYCGQDLLIDGLLHMAMFKAFLKRAILFPLNFRITSNIFVFCFKNFQQILKNVLIENVKR